MAFQGVAIDKATSGGSKVADLSWGIILVLWLVAVMWSVWLLFY